MNAREVYKLGLEMGAYLIKIKLLTPASPRRKPLLKAIEQNVAKASKLGVRVKLPDTSYDAEILGI